MNLVLSGTATISSIELLEKINELREQAGQPPVRRNVFNARVEDELDGFNYKSFVVEGQRGSDSVGYELTYDQALLVGMRESKTIRRAVLSYVEQLRDGQERGNPLVLARAELRSLNLTSAVVTTIVEVRAVLGDEAFWKFLSESKPLLPSDLPKRVYAYDKFAALDVGGSVEVEGLSAAPGTCKDYGNAVNYGLRTGKRFSGRKLGEGRVLITRVA